MITAAVFEGFEALWRRAGVFDKNLTYGQAFAQYSLCKPSDPLSDFLHNAPYPAVKAWIQEQIDGHKKANPGAEAQAVRKDTH